jgi:hypothetical protein
MVMLRFHTGNIRTNKNPTLTWLAFNREQQSPVRLGPKLKTQMALKAFQMVDLMTSAIFTVPK